MPDLLNFTADKIQLMLLLMMRIGGIMLTAPVFSHNSIPRRISIAITLGLTIIILPLFLDTALPPASGLVDLMLICAREILIGVLIGLIFAVLFLGIRLAGAIVGYQIGFAMVNVVDPNSSTQVSIIGEFWFLLGTLIFLALGGHHMILSSLIDSFRAMPLGDAIPTGAVGEWFIKYTAFAFVLAVKIAAPVMLTIFLIEISMGVLARTMPQMNIFIVGFPLKIFTGLLMVGISLPAFNLVLNKIMSSLDRELIYMMKIFRVNGV